MHDVQHVMSSIKSFSPSGPSGSSHGGRALEARRIFTHESETTTSQRWALKGWTVVSVTTKAGRCTTSFRMRQVDGRRAAELLELLELLELPSFLNDQLRLGAAATGAGRERRNVCCAVAFVVCQEAERARAILAQTHRPSTPTLCSPRLGMALDLGRSLWCRTRNIEGQ